MDYEGQICRGPLERGAFMLPVIVGCPYNKCKFCDLFKHLNYREIDLKDIENEIKRVKSIGGNPKKIFLGDGSAFTLSYKKLVEILNLIHDNFKKNESINADATITSIKSKTDEELNNLYNLGIRTLYIGIESGLDETLIFMDKDHDKREAKIQIERLKKAGINYAAHYMCGVSGKGRGEIDAKELAKFISQNKPKAIVNFSIFLSSKDLLEEINKKTYIPSNELDNLIQDKIFIENLKLDKNDSIVYDSYHDFIQYHFKGVLPKDREKMIKEIDKAIKKYEKHESLYSNHEIMKKLGVDTSNLGFSNREYMGLIDVFEKK